MRTDPFTNVTRYATTDAHRRWQERRRRFNKDNGRCINASMRGEHAPPLDGYVRCAACLETHRRSR